MLNLTKFNSPTILLNSNLKIPTKVSLIAGPTPLHEILNYSNKFDLDHPLMIKREDQTSVLYGGNKVRNLEFVLADAIKNKATHLKTLVPFGSNFTASLSSESQKLGLGLNLFQFMAQNNLQTRAHATFAQNHNASIKTYSGASGVMRAGIAFLNDKTSYSIAPGASSVLGAIGHFFALIEAIEQLSFKAPQFIFVGTGTCGNSAGLLAGITHLKLSTKLIGVKCAHPIVCNPRKVERLANKVLAQLGSSERVRSGQFTLIDSPGHVGYGIPSKIALDESKTFYSLEKIALDITYTSKVVAALKDQIIRGQISPKDRVLYWHTYSSKANPLN